MRALGVAALLGLFALAAGQSYSVDVSGGPLTLPEEVAEAAAAWNSASEEARLEQSAAAENRIEFADPELLGPDLVSATLVRDDEAGFDVWLNPEIYREFPQALIHELGLLLGLPSASSGVMDPALSGDSPEAPTEADLQALTAAQGRTGGDIDGDGVVGLADLAALGRAYGQRGVNLSADLDGDGVVGAADVELLRENYTFTAPAPVPEETEPAEDQPDANQAGSNEVGEADPDGYQAGGTEAGGTEGETDTDETEE